MCRLFILLILAATPGLALADGAPSFRGYHSHAEVGAALRYWARTHPRYVRLESIGESLRGRKLWLLRITDHDVGEPGRKVGVYVDGGHHGNEIASSEAALYLGHLLLSSLDLPVIKDLVRSHVFYLVPRVNPDASELCLKGVEVRGNLRPRDEDRDGVADEDGPEDLDGDGEITEMRRPNPRGRHVIQTGTGYMIPAGRWGTPGKRYQLWSEGLDNDGDGRINEDPLGGVDLNRNYPRIGSEPDKQPTEPETRAVLAFIRGHRNIAVVHSLHTFGGILFRPYGARHDRDIPRADLEVYDALAKGYMSRTGNNAYSRPYGPGRLIFGALLDYCYGSLGTFAFTAELWRPPGKDTRKTQSRWGGLESIMGEEARKRWQAFNEEDLGGKGHRAWKPFDHPTLGKVEIGGWRPFVRRNPPPKYLESLCRQIALFILDTARQAPRLVIRRPRLRRDGAGWELVVRVDNVGVLPTFSRQALAARRFARDMLGVELPAGIRLIRGERIRRFGPLAGGGDFVTRFELAGTPAKGARIGLAAVSEKGGAAQRSVAFPE